MRETRYWTLHVAAGAVILIFLGLHMTIMHLDDVVRVFNPHEGQPVAWANVLARSQMAFFMVTYIILLGAALYHGFYGLRVILFELSLGKSLRRSVNIALWFAGLSLFVIGTAAAIAAWLNLRS